MSSSDFSAFALFTAGLAAFAPVVSAISPPGGSNPTAGAVLSPDATTTVTAGQSFDVKWTVKTDGCGDKVDLVLLYGSSPATMNALSYIAQGVANSGSYAWTPASSLKASDGSNKYGIELVCAQTQAYQYTSRFGLANSNPSSSSASASGSASGGYGSSGSASATASASGASSHSATATSGSATSSSSAEPKYPTGNNSTATAGPTGTAPVSTASGLTSSTSAATGSKTSSSSSRTGSSTSSSASATSTGNGAAQAKAGFGGLLAAAAVAAFAL